MTSQTAPQPGRFSVIVGLLQDRQAFLEEVFAGVNLSQKISALLIASGVCFAVYGAIIGASASPQQAAASAVKLPILYLLTMLICFPTLFLFNVFFGAIQSFRQQFTLLLTAVAVISVLLVGFAPVTLFFLITAHNYQFFKLLNVGIFTITGVIGVTFFYQAMQRMAGDEAASAPGQAFRTRILRFWLVLYAFVGSQLGWTLRPFFGAPGSPFELFRNIQGNFYVDIGKALAEIFGFN